VNAKIVLSFATWTGTPQITALRGIAKEAVHQAHVMAGLQADESSDA
jgi:predicted nicotinamide N-methyase